MPCARAAGQLPLDLFQIDDGYQQAWGDWTTLDPAKYVDMQTAIPI